MLTLKHLKDGIAVAFMLMFLAAAYVDITRPGYTPSVYLLGGLLLGAFVLFGVDVKTQWFEISDSGPDSDANGNGES